MKQSRLLRGGMVVDVFRDTLVRADVLMEDGVIVTVGEVDAAALPAGTLVEDISGSTLCPGFIDGHIHIESTLLVPAELARVCAAHGTAALVADPHEIANVCGTDGLRYMLEASRGLPVRVLFALPSCVPATAFEESGATLSASDLRVFYGEPEVVALGEVMNYPGVLAQDQDLLQKIADARAAGRVVNGHAPGLLGEDLTRYIAAGVNDDHECSTFEEARQRIERGMWVMIREGSAARNLEALMPVLTNPATNRHCTLVTDDKHADDLLEAGHIDAIIRKAVRLGADPLVAVRTATIQAAQCFNLAHLGAIAPGYAADVVAVDNLEDFRVTRVWHAGEVVHDTREVGGTLAPAVAPAPAAAPTLASIAPTAASALAPVAALVTGEAFAALDKRMRHTFHLDALTPESFCIEAPRAHCTCHVIGVQPATLITDDILAGLDFSATNGTDPARDIAKIAVCERHRHTGHIGIGFITGLGLERGAVASSVSHDSHNLIVIGTNEADMAAAANAVVALGGGRAVVADSEVLASMPLPIGGIMSDAPAETVAAQSAAIDAAIARIGCAAGIDPIMNMAFSALTVIPHLKMTTHGVFDVNTQRVISVFAQGEDGEGAVEPKL